MSRSESHDPIAELSHDHSDLGVLVQAVRDTFVRVEGEAMPWSDALHELEDGAEALREGLLTHFAREEEALFPFLDRQLPELQVRVAALLADHDAVLRCAAELCRSVASARIGAEAEHARSAWLSFEETYARHAQDEHKLLRDVGSALDDGARRELRALLTTV